MREPVDLEQTHMAEVEFFVKPNIYSLAKPRGLLYQPN
jgi:hypothetical protein